VNTPDGRGMIQPRAAPEFPLERLLQQAIFIQLSKYFIDCAARRVAVNADSPELVQYA
jgi:hypothetical protein